MKNEQKMQMWMAGGFLGLIILITIIAGVASSNAKPSTTNNFVSTQTSAITPSDHLHGAAGSAVSLIEYGDFQCPACGAYEPLVQQLYTQYGNKVQFVFRNFPLIQVHQNAMIAAQAAEAANLQGKYWEMHDMLYSKQKDWSETPNASVVANYFDKYAQTLGLNVAKFNTDINSDTVKARVQSDVTLANAAQLNHTPTFFINLAQIQNPQSLTEFQKDLDTALASSTTTR